MGRRRFKDLVIVLALIGVVAVVSHSVIVNPMGPSRLLYFFQIPFVQWTTTCSSNAPSWMGELQRYATRRMGAPASQLAYVAPNQTLSHCEAGWKDGVWGGVPLSKDDRFRFASVTKTITALAVIDLVNQKKLSLNDRIVELLGVRGVLHDPRVADITIEHLLSHRGGWDRKRSQDVMFKMSSKPWCPRDVNGLAKTGLVHAPGEREVYSNLGYCLLGLVIERVTNEAFRDYMARRFNFESNDLAFVSGAFLPDEVLYDTRNESFFTRAHYQRFDFEALSSAAGLSGNASDLAILLHGTLDWEPYALIDGFVGRSCESRAIQQCFGYGVYRYLSAPNAMPLYIQDGRLPGATAAIFIDPKGGILVWLGAGAPPKGGGVLQAFYEFVHDSLASEYFGEAGSEARSWFSQ